MNHKRRAADRDVTFRPPAFHCFACNDTGIVGNGDAALLDYLPDYDRTAGRMTGGSDLALICHCEAARSEFGPDGSIIRNGLREGSGRIRQVDTEQGRRAVGIDCPVDWVREIHKRRTAQWIATTEEVTRARRERLAGDATASPWFIAEVKPVLDEISKVAQAMAAERAAKREQGRRLQPIGAILGGAADLPSDLSQMGAVVANPQQTA